MKSKYHSTTDNHSSNRTILSSTRNITQSTMLRTKLQKRLMMMMTKKKMKVKVTAMNMNSLNPCLLITKYHNRPDQLIKGNSL